MKLLRFLFLLLLLVVFWEQSVLAQTSSGDWNQAYDPHVAALGLSAGFSSGSGLAIRWPALTQTMMSVSGGVWGEGKDLSWNFGSELHLILRQVDRVRVFTGPAIAFYSDSEDDEIDVNISLGIGLEILLSERVAAKVDLGFTWLGENGDIFPLPQMAIYYYF